MEAKSQAPSFTVSLRGYDREEVDEYLDSLAEALARVEEAEQHSRRLQSHVARCNTRIKELEDRIRADTPKSGVALGERIGMLLREAEDAAAEIVTRAESDASRIMIGAEQRAAESDERIRHSTALAEEQARRIESVARGEAAEIVSEAEARAVARTRQIEQWAEQVVSHTRAEEARMVAEHRRAKAAKDVELDALEEHRVSAVAALTELQESLARAVGLISEPAAPPASLESDDAVDGGPASSFLVAPADSVVEAPALVEAPVLVEGPAPADARLEASVADGVEAPADAPADAPVEAPADASVEASADAPVDEVTDSPMLGVDELVRAGEADAGSAADCKDAADCEDDEVADFGQADDRDRTGELPAVVVERPINDATARLAADLPATTAAPRVVGVFDVEAADDENDKYAEYGPGRGDAQFEAKLDRWVSGGR